MKIKTIFGSFFGLALVFALTTLVLGATTVVHPGNMDGWGFAQETATGFGSMVSGPDTPPLGTGSANLIVDSSGGVVLAKAEYAGMRLDEVTALEYSTYRTSGGPALAIALQLNFDADLTDADDSWQGRLVYEPYHTQTVNTGVWETWNALDDTAGTATGNWWFSNASHATNSGCSMATPCTWDEVMTFFPNGGVHNTLGAVLLKAGGGWSGGFDGNVDALRVNDDVYDFELDEPVVEPEPVGPPTSKDECKDEGWMTFNNPTFENQGSCVSYVQSSENAGKRN